MKRFKITVLLPLFTLISVACKEEPKSSEKDIISFSLEEETKEAIINNDNREVFSEVLLGTDLTNLQPVVELSVAASSNPKSGETVDFSTGPVIYTVVAEDETTAEWTVTVEQQKSSEAKIISFEISSQTDTANINDSTVEIFVDRETDLTSIAPVIVVSSGAAISPESGAVVDFSDGSVIYTVTSSDGTVKEWTVNVKPLLSDERDIISITIQGQVGETVRDGDEFRIDMPVGTDLSALAPVFEVSPYATINPVSGTLLDFSENRAVLIVTSESGIKKYYYLYVKHKYISPSHEYIQYTGRIDFSDPERPKFWAPGIYITAKFRGTYCNIGLEGSTNNYLDVIVDGERKRVKAQEGNYTIVDGLSDGEHTITICKDTESNIGYLIFTGILCDELLPPDPKPERRLEFYGNSITCGTGADLSEVACGAGAWHDQHNAYMSYGPVTARKLNAQWHLSSYSGIGMIHSCCGLTFTMPDVYDHITLNTENIPWDFSNYQPDAVTICLGQNDGIQDSATFCGAYVDFINDLRSHYPNAEIVCLTSPMADATLIAYMKNCLTGIVDHMNNAGDTKVYKFYFSKQYSSGCDYHPDLAEHEIIATELSDYLKTILGW